MSAYHLCKLDEEGSVEMQQLCYLRDHDIDDIEPHEDDDLMNMLDYFLDKGHKIILMGDFNLPTDLDDLFTRKIWALGMIKIIFVKYKVPQGSLPLTH